MTQYDNRNSGALFSNDRKIKSSHPDYKGSMTDANGQEFWISAWVKQGKKGEFLSLAFEKKEDASVAGPRTLGSPKGPQMPRHADPAPRSAAIPPAPRNTEELDDDLPF